MYKLPSTLQNEINEYAELIKQFRAGTIETAKFKGTRVPMGIYEQRIDDTYMTRIRCVGGHITAFQLKRIAQIARKYNAEFVHITTRQELQIQGLQLEDTQKILHELYEIGLATRGGGGNTVRNIMASIDSGIAPNEVFDVLPYAVSLTEKLISESDSWTLPRKFKIAFSNTDKDNSYAIYNDLGFIATEKNGKKGFKVFLGGSLALNAMVGYQLFDFVPDEDIYYITDAAKKLFSRYGNRRNKHKARLRYVFYKLGKDKVFEIFHEIYNELKQTGNQPFKLRNDLTAEKQTLTNLKQEICEGSDFTLWKERFVSKQKQKGLNSVSIPVHLGNLSADILEDFADFLINFGGDVIRFTMRQNILLRNIPAEYLGNVFNSLINNKFETNKTKLVNSLVACTGADTCRLGICLSQGVLGALKKKIQKSDIGHNGLSDLNINISGCPNACGQHIIADLGFFGRVGRNDRIYPSYNVVAGAKTGVNNSKLAEKICSISARDMPDFTVDLLKLYKSESIKYTSFSDFIDAEKEKAVKEIADKYNKNIPDFADDKNYYFDWGANNLFSLVGRGIGECSAGLFDMIDVDYNKIKQLRNESKKQSNLEEKNESLRKIVFHSSRMLLITRGAEPKFEEEVYDFFLNKFIDAGLINEKFTVLIENARDDKNFNFSNEKDKIYELATAIIDLYEGMDDSLQFNLAEPFVEQKPEKEETVSSLKKDFRGVACPMNFVKTKLALSTMKSNELLEVLLDDGEPIDNVPGSVKSEGHKILELTKMNGYWLVMIQKK